jgi:hypothetical protein
MPAPFRIEAAATTRRVHERLHAATTSDDDASRRAPESRPAVAANPQLLEPQPSRASRLRAPATKRVAASSASTSGETDMLAIKPAAVLLVVGLGGLVGIHNDPALRAASHEGAAPAQAQPDPPAAPGSLALRADVQAALLARVRRDLDDPDATLTLGRFVVSRPSLRMLEAQGDGEVAMAGSDALPVRVEATYDLIDHRLDTVDYSVATQETAATPAPAPVRAALARRIDAKLAGEFRGQPVHFSLVSVDQVDYGRHRTLMTGSGLTDFGAEGRAYTPFVATLDKHTGELVDLRYDLLQEDDASIASR